MVDLAAVTDAVVIGQGVGVLARNISATSAETTIADGEPEIVGDPGITSVATDDEDLPELCQALGKNMTGYNRGYWNAVTEGNDVLAQYYREAYYASKRAWNGLACDFHSSTHRRRPHRGGAAQPDNA